MANTKSTVQTQKQYRCSWITVVGWSPQAVLNTLWCACEQGVVPDRLVLLHSQGDNRVQQNLSRIERQAKILLQEFGRANPHIEKVPIQEDDIPKFYSQFNRVVDKESLLAEGLIIDCTPGRKYMSAFAMVRGMMKTTPVRKLYYLHLAKQEYQNQYAPLIPRPFQHLYDLRDQMNRPVQSSR